MAGLYVIIAGAGKVGWNLARELLEKGHEVTVLEQDRRRYLTVEQELEHPVQYGVLELLLDDQVAPPVLLDQRDLVALLDQLAREVPADLARAGDDHVQPGH